MQCVSKPCRSIPSANIDKNNTPDLPKRLFLFHGHNHPPSRKTKTRYQVKHQPTCHHPTINPLSSHFPQSKTGPG
ncbi:hypothetical protein DL95DRAFT_12295 [Leptodontidium sp. 2 PMI_412]|nr:hypothetical protein DL95DRAFT_12295 [Leptodontidium sp. 2 PMI_412]